LILNNIDFLAFRNLQRLDLTIATFSQAQYFLQKLPENPDLNLVRIYVPEVTH
jgi:hypothetical protein